MDINGFYQFLWAWIAIALILFPIQLFITAPYGRHTTNKWGRQIDNKLGWVVMELASLLFFSYFFLTGENEITSPMWVFFAFWFLHYLNRSIIYPLRTRTSGKKIPIIIVLSAIFFNVINGWTNGYYLGSISNAYPAAWLYSPQFILGILIFMIGAVINISSDNKLLKLRNPGETSYSIPKGGLFKYISCPNHFGEIIEWTGFAIMCWNLAAVAFAIWTAANLIPRAISHHKWYKSNFNEYPANRKAVFPFIV